MYHLCCLIQFINPYAGEVISGLLNSVEQSGAKYTVLYVSDPVRSIQYPTYRELERFLAEGAVGNGSANLTGCDEVCKFKSSLLEGILVVSCCLFHSYVCNLNSYGLVFLHRY